MSQHFTILLAGDCTPSPRLCAEVEGTRVIAADDGMRHAVPLGLEPELWVGDFDSADRLLRRVHDRTPREAHPVAKDATDGEIAIRTALGRGADRLTVVGAFGGPRLDHALGTVALALSLAKRARIALTDGRQWAYPLVGADDRAIPHETGALLSIVGYTELEGLSVSGARWPLDRADIPFGSSRTLSNELRSPQGARVALREGRALVVVHPSDD